MERISYRADCPAGYRDASQCGLPISECEQGQACERLCDRLPDSAYPRRPHRDSAPYPVTMVTIVTIYLTVPPGLKISSLSSRIVTLPLASPVLMGITAVILMDMAGRIDHILPAHGRRSEAKHFAEGLPTAPGFLTCIYIASHESRQGPRKGRIPPRGWIPPIAGEMSRSDKGGAGPAGPHDTLQPSGMKVS